MTGLSTDCRILVVEDEMLVLMEIEAVLKEIGCVAIRAAASVAGALALLDGQRFDAAIIDVNLGDEKSYPVADSLARRGIPFAFSTGYGDHNDHIVLYGRPILKKPYVRAALVAVLEQLLDGGPLPIAA